MTALALLAGKTPTANQVVPGVLGFLVVAALGLILFFLLRSMNKQLRKVIGGPRWQEDSGKQGSGKQGAQPPSGAAASGGKPGRAKPGAAS